MPTLPLCCWARRGHDILVLPRGTPEQVVAHTRATMVRGRQCPGFVIPSCGQLPGNIPLENMLAYFRTRDEMGCDAEV